MTGGNFTDLNFSHRIFVDESKCKHSRMKSVKPSSTAGVCIPSAFEEASTSSNQVASFDLIDEFEERRKYIQKWHIGQFGRRQNNGNGLSVE
jgi:hypothetical protein